MGPRDAVVGVTEDSAGLVTTDQSRWGMSPRDLLFTSAMESQSGISLTVPVRIGLAPGARTLGAPTVGYGSMGPRDLEFSISRRRASES
jgi:hypothetical protein